MHVVSYTRKTNFLSYKYQLCHATITHTSSIKDVGVFFDSKLYFHSNGDNVFSECMKLLGLICSITCSFLPGVFVCTVLYFSQVQAGICLGSLELCHVHWCQ
jgi:hypothetical protein